MLVSATADLDLLPFPATHPSTAGPLEVQVLRVRAASDVAPLLDAWEDLAAHAAEPNVFYEPTVFVPALEAYRPDLHLVLVSARDTSGPEGLLGFFPVERVAFSRRPWIPVPTLRLWSWAHCFLSTPLVRKGAVAEALEAFLRWARGRWAFGLLELPTVSAEGPVGQPLLEELRSSGLEFRARRWERALWSPEPEAADSYVARSLSGKKRKELRRLRRRLAEEGALDLVELGPASGELAGCPVLEAWTDDFFLLEESGWKGAHGTALHCDLRDREFFRRLVAAAHAKGRLEMLALRLDGRPIAMKCNLRAADGAFAFKIAYDEAYARYSPGFLLEIETIEALARRGTTRWLDTCAAPGHPMAESLFTERRVLQNVLVATGPTGYLVLNALRLKRRFLQDRDHVARQGSRKEISP